MTRKNDIDESGIEALARLWDGISIPSQADLDAVARLAAAGQRAILRPRGGGLLRTQWAIALAGLALVVGSGLGFGLGSSLTPSGNAAAQDVSMGFVRFYDPACRCYKARVSGRVSNGRAGEYVVVLEEFCGRGSGRSVVAATSRDGGAWDAVIEAVLRPDSDVAVSYRARWNEELSEPVSFRGRLSVAGQKQRVGTQRVTVRTPEYNPVDLKGRQVVLQRRIAGRWARIASTRLSPHRTRFYTFTATFTVPKRGWQVRALVAAKAAAPCFSARASEPWVS